MVQINSLKTCEKPDGTSTGRSPDLSESELVIEGMVRDELDELHRDELEGSWRAICAAMLLRTHNLTTTTMGQRKEIGQNKNTAFRWLSNQFGVIRFSTVCDTLNLDEQRIRQAILDNAASDDYQPINRGNHKTFGR